MTRPQPFESDPFSSGGSLPETLPDDPWGIFKAWWDLAHTANDGGPVQPNPSAMALATVGDDGSPSCRVVLCRMMDLDAGRIVFFTNRNSTKGKQLDAHPVAAACFHWDALERQIRIEGPITRSPDTESDAYFAQRATISKLGAWASDQSSPVGSRDELLAKYAEVLERFNVGFDVLMGEADGTDIEIPRPPFWGGYRLWARRVELWIGGKGRFHDRAVWTRELDAAGEAFAGGPWRATRLQP
ncbi:MAG TPA: pyridoxamine 5'-phosphate oxidase [Phycisphaerales bacterium]|nr:pyridoxamine 5'-phosphate oxidase [Phycisphaerales bacterium]